MAKPRHDGQRSNEAERGRGPTPSQLDAALEGARDPINFNSAQLIDARSPLAGEQQNAGGSGPATGTAHGAGDSTAGPAVRPQQPGVEPEEAIKRDTAVFEPGTMRKPR